MALLGPGRPASILSSVTLQLLLKLTAVYFVFYFLFTLGLIIRKSLVLSYPADALIGDVSLLFLLAALQFLHLFCDVRVAGRRHPQQCLTRCIQCRWIRGFKHFSPTGQCLFMKKPSLRLHVAAELAARLHRNQSNFVFKTV
ncbi:transmembrane protein 80-like isoform X2 [Sebastes umbrosus]|uniref:transmembrane protein 80-like isoform X2 n=1 Tax=Sebastes umbrosus TaxID=72105 RepID=UPI00189EE58D|nr:transmembrane protein 80-like isoform X2 [Sebastes umbrosus]